MSVVVEDLTKVYGKQRAVDSISFSAKEGQVLGFLGSNGAGKSTTMKILTCFLPQTSGKASVCGYDINRNPIEVRRNIGYLPENNPLYLDLYVKESLSFVAGLHDLEDRSQKIDRVIEMTGLGPERNKKIGELSKGYRQRVGIAQAILHDPKVLILDEPTSGLDPNQLISIRQLIKELGKTKTVILSTHIMQEVEAICSHVVIINQGKIVLDDSLKDILTVNVNRSLEDVFVGLTSSTSK
jgi:ABC-2 type transport system ATP-binding protein